MKMNVTTIVFVAAAMAWLGCGLTPAWAESGVEAVAAGTGENVEMGTDPRDFAPKFMPYYRYTELKNELTQHEVTLFGLFAFSKKFAMTYEIPLAKEVDIKDTAGFKAAQATGTNVPIIGGDVTIPNGLIAKPERDGEETGVGDMNLRFMYNAGDWAGATWLLGSQFDFPTATEPELGSEQFQIGPMFAVVKDIEAYPAPGAFFAAMNFYFFDAFGESSRPDVSMYVGRWFLMFPLTPPEKGPLWGGWYMLPEMQPVYDFENSHFSFWFAPEIGKMLSPGNIAYVKPGWGISPEGADREFTFEAGWRWFF
jgi:hypothetical protein